jgi:hypothetical protein
VSPRTAGILAFLAWPSALLLALSAFSSRVAYADTASLAGSWNMSAVNETFTVQQWSSACGPAPVTGTAQPGATVRVRADGPELVIEGGRRTLRTDGCIDGMPTLSSEAHSTDGQSWRTRCATPQSDPRRATINTAYFLTSADTIQIAETGRYELTIKGAYCVADVKRDASLHKVSGAPAVATGAAPPPFATSLDTPAPVPSARPSEPPAPKPAAPSREAKFDCNLPGPAARLEVRPSRKLLHVGDTFAFRAVVVDSAGCVTGTPIQWAVGNLAFKDQAAHGNPPTVDAAGKLAVPSDCPDATFDVVATAAGHSARASVEVASPATYEALLAQSGLGPSGEQDEPAVAIMATSSIGASDVQAEDTARQRRTLFAIVVGALVVLLGIVGVVAASRARKARAVEQAAESRHAERMRDYQRQKQAREEAHTAQMNAHLESVAQAQQAAEAAAARGVDAGPMFCPSCRREFAGGGGAYCPYDSNRLVPIAGHQDIIAGPSGGICPTCRRGFNPGVKVCPHDGEELVPAAMMTAAINPPAPARGKICPTCGGRFDGTAAFCGKDGTQLVLLN